MPARSAASSRRCLRRPGGGYQLRRHGAGARCRDRRAKPDGGVRASWDPAGQQLLDVSAADPGWSGNGNLTAEALSSAAGRTEDLVAWGQPCLRRTATARRRRTPASAYRRGARSRALPGPDGRATWLGAEIVAPERPFNGKVYVTGVRHEFSRTTGRPTPSSLPREMHAERVPMNHLPAASIAAAVHGLQVGVMTALAEDPGKEHRIRVKVPLAGMDEQGVGTRGDARCRRPARRCSVPRSMTKSSSVSSMPIRPNPSCSECFTAAPRRRRSSRPPTTTTKVRLAKQDCVAVRRQKEGRHSGNTGRQQPDAER